MSTGLIDSVPSGRLQGSGARTLQRVVCAPKSFFELCPQLFEDPDYLQWVNSTDPTADRYLIDRVVARWSGQPGRTDSRGQRCRFRKLVVTLDEASLRPQTKR